MEWVQDRIEEVDGVEEVFRVWSAYDIIALANVESIEELQAIVLNIQTMKHVLSTTTLMERVKLEGNHKTVRSGLRARL